MAAKNGINVTTGRPNVYWCEDPRLKPKLKGATPYFFLLTQTLVLKAR